MRSPGFFGIKIFFPVRPSLVGKEQEVAVGAEERHFQRSGRWPGSVLQFLLRVGPRTLLMGGAEETGQAKLLAGFPWKTHGKLSLGSEIENDFVTKI